jgi:hypothetical protein
MDKVTRRSFVAAIGAATLVPAAAIAAVTIYFARVDPSTH